MGVLEKQTFIQLNEPKPDKFRYALQETLKARREFKLSCVVMKLNALHKYWNSTISFSRPEAGGSPKKGRSRPESEGERYQA